MKEMDFNISLYLCPSFHSISPFSPCVALIFNFAIIVKQIYIYITARIKQNTSFNTILQNRIQKARILCIFISFLFFRPLHPQLPASAIPLLLSFL